MDAVSRVEVKSEVTSGQQAGAVTRPDRPTSDFSFSVIILTVDV